MATGEPSGLHKRVNGRHLSWRRRLGERWETASETRPSPGGGVGSASFSPGARRVHRRGRDATQVIGRESGAVDGDLEEKGLALQGIET